MSDQMVGEWTGFHKLDAVDMALFDSVVVHLLGVKYTPLLVATQVVSGRNYCFLSEAVGLYPKAKTDVVIIYIYKPLDGDAHITHIDKVLP
ncbi:hypothetical protein PCO86_15525 [Pectobacteriaceae bacterium CE70]|uniref:Uncharacterized protein n=1 Tax=Serratia sp. (strain ATCC 39006) TaxID=104623 RepID=A0A2I5T652_SERS3|nr:MULTISPECIES: hypothetical protein [Enterobacterales]WJV61439.1 hypothetical protein PCO87_16230 [Pectobacteriaceae bacterium C52]WJV65712.1 hypothetical protein PCO86_15525 [Pectobacteriaceae bacterium CE70]WJY09733.1 hypothetical protein PCO80_15460 [Pectobacteriaceae bacterium C80]AUH00060.1 hypothetical protein CWC46_09745 [Serratia sp. ATCC 39006]AUH04379.1 hypothetical protein Ser39006_009750 [Serratia sp. ATCC 39006]